MYLTGLYVRVLTYIKAKESWPIWYTLPFLKILTYMYSTQITERVYYSSSNRSFKRHVFQHLTSWSSSFALYSTGSKLKCWPGDLPS